jgi:beta-lactamase regulating signal transducer with metallopeptidase domain
MHPLLHSPFLQALGYTIINSLWQFALLWLLYFAINTIFKLSSQQKYAAGLTLEIAGFTWFIVTLIFYYNQSKLLPEYNLIDQASLPAVLANTGSTFKQQFFLLILRFEQFFPYLSIAYLALLFVLFMRWLYAYKFTQQVRVAGLEEKEEQWKLFVQKLSLQLGIKRRVHIFLSELVQTPLTVGFLKPVILIPIATINYLNPQQMEAVIIHELAHIRRYDYLFNLLLALIEASLFFNPFMQLIHQQVKKERENCCDDWVLKYEYSAASYARALLQIASNQTQRTLLALNATDNKKLLISRIKRIIENNEHTFFNHKYQLLALLVLTTVFSALSFLSPSKKITRSFSSKAHQKIVFEPMAAKVNNPLFNPVFFLANSSKIEQPKKKSEIKSLKTKIAIARLPEPGELPVETNPVAAFIADEDVKILEPASTPKESEVRAAEKADRLKLVFEKSLKNAERSNGDVKLGNWFSQEASQQMEVASNYLKRLQKETGKEKESAINIEKVKTQLNNALQQIRASKKQVELSRLRGIVRLGIKKIEKEKVATLLPDMNVFKLNELELIERQIEKEVDSINASNHSEFFNTRVNANSNFTFELPAVVYTTPEKPHNFSFQYSTRPARVPTITAPREARIYLKKNEAIKESDDNCESQSVEIAPQPPARTVKFKSVYIIRI